MDWGLSSMQFIRTHMGRTAEKRGLIWYGSDGGLGTLTALVCNEA